MGKWSDYWNARTQKMEEPQSILLANRKRVKQIAESVGLDSLSSASDFIHKYYDIINSPDYQSGMNAIEEASIMPINPRSARGMNAIEEASIMPINPRSARGTLRDDFRSSSQMEIHHYQCPIERIYIDEFYTFTPISYYKVRIVDKPEEPYLKEIAKRKIEDEAKRYRTPRQIGDKMVVIFNEKWDQDCRWETDMHIKVGIRLRLFLLHIPIELYKAEWMRNSIIRQAQEQITLDSSITTFQIRVAHTTHQQLLAILEAQNQPDWGGIPAVPAKEGQIFL